MKFKNVQENTFKQIRTWWGYEHNEQPLEHHKTLEIIPLFEQKHKIKGHNTNND